MNVAKPSQKFFCLSNIQKNVTFIENNFFPEMARLWTFFPNRKWFQLFVYFFSKKKKFSLKDYPNSFYVFLNVPKSFLPFLNIFITKPETTFCQTLGAATAKTVGVHFLLFGYCSLHGYISS